jgi:hypothetical protein
MDKFSLLLDFPSTTPPTVARRISAALFS